MPSKIHYINLLLVALVLTPNLLMLLRPPLNMPNTASSNPLWILVVITERIGQLGVFTLPLLWQAEFSGNRGRVALALMGLSLLVYYIGWARYVLGGGEYRLLFQPLGFLPLPLALAPVMYFLAVGMLIRSWPMALAAMVLAIGHITESWRQFVLTKAA